MLKNIAITRKIKTAAIIMRLVAIALSLLVLLGLTSCGIIKPYRVDVQQGNVLETKTVQQLEVGMTKSEVENLLGTPVLDNAFANSSWLYTYTSQINGGKIEKKQLVLHFANNKLTKIEKRNL